MNEAWMKCEWDDIAFLGKQCNGIRGNGEWEIQRLLMNNPFPEFWNCDQKCVDGRNRDTEPTSVKENFCETFQDRKFSNSNLDLWAW